MKGRPFGQNIFRRCDHEAPVPEKINLASKHIGSDFNEWLRQEELLEECREAALAEIARLERDDQLFNFAKMFQRAVDSEK